MLDADQGVKIGITGHLASRRTDFERSYGQPITLLAAYAAESRAHAWRVEQDAHWLLRDDRTVGEWFHCHPLHAVDVVERLISLPYSSLPLSVVHEIRAAREAA